jgi:hypothetical protein
MNYWLMFFFLMGIGFAKAQDADDDAAFWLSANLEKKVAKNLVLQGGEQMRLNNNFRDAGLFTTNVSAIYKLITGIRIEGDYAFRQNQRLDGSYGLRHRFSFSGVWRHPFGKWLLMYRNRTQAQFIDWQSRENGNIPSWHNRNRFTIRYEISKRLDAYMSAEAYIPLNMPNRPRVDRQRMMTGISYNLSKKTKLEGSFLLQFNHRYANAPRRDFVYGISFSHEL